MRITIEDGGTVAAVEVDNTIFNLPSVEAAAMIGEQVGLSALVVHDVANMPLDADISIKGASDVSEIETVVNELHRLADDGNPHHA